TLWDVEGEQIHELAGPGTPAWAAAFLPDGRRAVSAAQDGTVRLWGLPGVPGRVVGEVRRYEGHGQAIGRAAVSPHGRYALSGGLGRGATVVLWELASGLEVRRFAHPASVRFVTFAPDGKHFFSGAEDRVGRLWDVASGREVRRFQGHEGIVWWAAFTAD